MEPIRFLTDLTVALAIAGVAGFAASRIGLTPILGYVLAGIIVGPFTPGYVAQPHTLASLSDLGLIFLLFSLGLGFSLHELFASGWRAIVASLVLMGALIAALGLGLPGSLAAHPWTLGLVAAVSSTAIGAALLDQWKLTRTKTATFVLALLVVQDVVSVALIVVASAPAAELSATGIAVPLLKAVGFVALALVLGATVLHRLVRHLLKTAPAEALFPSFAAVALVAAWLSHFAGLSLEFGAFVAGMVISEAAGSRMVDSIIAPFRALFVALFFVSIGTLLDPSVIAANWARLLGIAAVLMALRFTGWGIVGRIGGFSLKRAALIGLAMVPMGEFNIVLAQAATNAGRLNAPEQSILLSIVFATIILAAIAAPFAARLKAGPVYAHGAGGDAESTHGRALLIGYGRVGKTVGAILERLDVAFNVIETDRATVATARSRGVNAVAADGMDPFALERAVGDSTQVVLSTTPSSAVNGAIVDRIRSQRGRSVIARASIPEDVESLKLRGAASAFVPETEGALVFARAVLEQLGFTAEEIDAAIETQRVSET